MGLSLISSNLVRIVFYLSNPLSLDRVKSGIIFSSMSLNIRQLEESGKNVEEAKGNLQTLYEQLTQLFLQQKENEIVLEEFEFLNETDVVMKQVGPTLVTQELSEAKQNVQSRIDYINNQIKTVEAKVEEAQKALKAAQQKLQEMQSSVQ